MAGGRKEKPSEEETRAAVEYLRRLAHPGPEEEFILARLEDIARTARGFGCTLPDKLPEKPVGEYGETLAMLGRWYGYWSGKLDELRGSRDRLHEYCEADTDTRIAWKHYVEGMTWLALSFREYMSEATCYRHGRAGLAKVHAWMALEP